MGLLKLLLFAIPLGFLFASGRYAVAAPSATAAAAMLLWWLDPKAPPRLAGWGSLALGVAVAWFRDVDGLAIGAILPAAAFLLLEFLARRRSEAEPPQAAVLLCAVALCIAGYTLPAATSQAKPLGSVTRIVAIGDSLTSGVPGDDVGTRWPETLAKKLGGEAVNLSYPGDTTIESFDRWQKDVAARRWKTVDPGWQPDLFVIELGGNDITHKRSPQEVEQGLERWIQALQPAGGTILLVACPGALFADPYQDVWKNVAARHDNVEWMTQETLRTIFTTGSYTLPDHIHFSQAGNDFFAEQVYLRIKGQR
jgi:lysophospholipase L1-like esterase